VNGGSTLLLTAATIASSSYNAIPGVVFAGTSQDTLTLAGNSNSRFTGVLYFPRADLRFSGTSGLGSSGCLQIIASRIRLSGTTDLATDCSDYGTLEYGSLPALKTIALVQ
jgi:hypothetical protein